MEVDVRMDPQRPPMALEEFCRIAPPRSVGIDGCVDSGPWRDFGPTGPRYVWNHHSHVDRLATRATCMQALLELRCGDLEEHLRGPTGRPHVIVYADDCDQDVSSTITILRRSELFKYPINPLANRFTGAADLMDTFAGAYPYPSDLELLEELAWIFGPYDDFRREGGLARKIAAEYLRVVDLVGANIVQYLIGRGERRKLDLRYDVLRTGNGWTMVREHGAQARTKMRADDIRVFVSVSERSSGTRDIRIGKMRLHTRGDLTAICDDLNARERATTDRWGGGSNIIGSPKVAGTTLDDRTLIEVLDRHLGIPLAA
ncbi:hypothetical protein HY632_04745 [Candidatus Uhrbacteria bacterium]|nr:hypothetical protein [Candidatus Uhrbacteria bacterium]